MSEKKEPRCEGINHPNLMPGWGCCQCRTFNGEQRTECKWCHHKRCDHNPDNRAS